MGTVFSVISSKFRRGAPRRRATTAAAHRASNRASDPPRSATSGSAQNFGKRSLLISRLTGRIALLRYTYPIQNRSTTVERTRRRHGWRMRALRPPEGHDRLTLCTHFAANQKKMQGNVRNLPAYLELTAQFLTERTVHSTASTHSPLTRHARRDAHESGIVK